MVQFSNEIWPTFRLTETKVSEIQFRLLNLKPISKEYYFKFITHASNLMADRDPKDTDLLALALKENIQIWSNDKNYDNTGVKILTTAKLLTTFR